MKVIYEDDDDNFLCLQDIISKITSFVESCSCNCYIASATGCVAKASILECGTASTHEVRSQIIPFHCRFKY